MFCFFVTERVLRGFPVHRDQRGAALAHAPTRVKIAQDLQNGINRIPSKYWVSIGQAMLDYTKEGAVLRRCYKDDGLALVLLNIQPGKGGKVWLTSTDTTTGLDRGRAKKNFQPLPVPGVDLLCEDTLARQIYDGKGLSALDVMLSMRPGSELRIIRSGDLTSTDGSTRPRELFMYWDHNRFRSSLRLMPRERQSLRRVERHNSIAP
jgi:hypothetical protein